MLQATWWGAVAGSAVLLGSLTAMQMNMSRSMLGWIMAFGVGVLIGAATFDLLVEAMNRGGVWPTGIGFMLGAFVFTVINGLIGKKGGSERKRSTGHTEAGEVQRGTGLAIFIGTLLDAIPESAIVGMGLVKGEGISWVIVSAIFISNFPEGLSSTVGLLKDGYSHKKLFFMWTVVMLLSSFCSFAGFVLLGNLQHVTSAVMNAFAAGAVVSMAASTMMPEAYEEGGAVVGLVTAGGLLSALLLAGI